MVKVLTSLFLFLVIMGTGANILAQNNNPAQGNGAAQAGDGKKEVVQPKEKISKIQMYLKPFVYDRDTYRDPFESQSGQTPLEAGQVYGPFLEVQTIKLSEFKLKGLLWKTSKPVAIFQAPNKKTYKLTIKDYIGENFGYIATIREKEVVIIQTIEENNRRYSTTKVVFLESI